MGAQTRRQVLALQLLLSGVLLCALVPGGPIENRDFSTLSPAVVLLFNILLTGLGLGSFLALPGVLRADPLALRLVRWMAILYLAVYLLDLLGWFPQSPTPMSPSLLLVETLGVGLALGMLLCLYGAAPMQEQSRRPAMPGPLAVLLVVMLALAIIAFATWSALGAG